MQWNAGTSADCPLTPLASLSTMVSPPAQVQAASGNKGGADDATSYEAALQRKIRDQALQMQQQGHELAWASDFARLCEEKVRQVDPTADMLQINKVRTFRPW